MLIVEARLDIVDEIVQCIAVDHCPRDPLCHIVLWGIAATTGKDNHPGIDRAVASFPLRRLDE
jgi:hypothetical protein